MKTIGLIGGTTWHSTKEYYQQLNEKTADQLGDKHSAKILMYSLDFKEILDLQLAGKTEEVQLLLIKQAQMLEKAGADCLMLGANTMHRWAEIIQNKLSIPVIHIADATANEIKSRGLDKVALMGTRITMEEDFYKVRLKEKHGIEVLIPETSERDYINQSIYEDFSRGVFTKDHKATYLGVIENLVQKGVQGIILGCTEIPLLIKQQDVKVPVFDTLNLHTNAAVKFALGS